MAAQLVKAVSAQRPRSEDEARSALESAALNVMSKRDRKIVSPLPSGERARERGEKDQEGEKAPEGEKEREAVNPALILFYGINGAGKTTTAGKLAHRLKGEGRRPMIVAADTFRAAGIEQMAAWARRAGVDLFEGRGGADPASVVFDGISSARGKGCDVVLVDTAGRLQTQRNLLEELAKVGRVATKALEGEAYESLLVLDAVLGLTSLAQAREFNRAIPVTGIVLAKLDGSAKGGAVISIEAELGVPVKLAGVGEGIDDLVPFEPEAFIRSLFEA
jgi:fused signal recognition particle receptor